MEQSITFASFVLCISLASAQLTFRLDANSNTYSLRTPNSQQTFTQHFNSRNGAAAHQGSAALQSQQQQLFSTGPHQFAQEQNSRQDNSNDYYRQQLELQQRLQQQQQLQLQQQQLQLQQQQQQQYQQQQGEQSDLYTTYQQPQQIQQNEQQREQGQQQVYSAQDLSPYYQQIQQAQLEQQQRQQFAGQQQFAAFQNSPQVAAAAAANGAENGQDGSSFAQYEPQSQKYQSQQQAVPNRILGSAFSPSNEVSHVKFSNAVSSYDF